MLLKLVVFSVLVTLGLCKIVSYKDCGSVTGKISSVDFSPCDLEPCVLRANNTYTTRVNFTSLANSSTAKTVVHGIIGGVPVPFPVPSDCCTNHNIPCPIVQEHTYSYANKIYCSPDYPKIKLVVKWEVQDDDGKDIFCFEAPLVID